MERDYSIVHTKIHLGGRGGIRTPETVASLHAFQACALGHYATLPFELNCFSGKGLRNQPELRQGFLASGCKTKKSPDLGRSFFWLLILNAQPLYFILIFSSSLFLHNLQSVSRIFLDFLRACEAREQ